MPKANQYVDWIRKALAEQPHLSQAGLTRHIGRDRSVVSNILTGKRSIKAKEIEQIAAYLGVPPPGLPTQFIPLQGILEVRIMGRISRSEWSDASEFEPVGRARVPAVPDERFRFDDQIGFEVAPAVSRQLDNSSHVVAVPAGMYRQTPVHGDLFVVRRKQGELISYQALKAQRRGERIVLCTLDDTIETIQPDYWIIMTMSVRA